MENTTQNKTFFYAVYWGQQVLRYRLVDEKSPHALPTEPNIYSMATEWSIIDSYLHLKNVADITDKECLHIAELFGIEKGLMNYQKKVDYVKNWLKDRDKNITRLPKDNNTEVIWQVVDYLRHNGYATSWMGISVEQQIEYGWVKLIETTNGNNNEAHN